MTSPAAPAPLASDYPPLGPEVDRLFPIHPEMDHRTTQTLYYSYNVPERNLNGEIYVWMHPGIRSVSAGTWVTQGFKDSALATDYFDWRAHMPYPEGDLRDIVIGHSLHVRTVEPGERVLIDYADSDRGFALELDVRAVVPPIARSNIFDFEKNFHGKSYPQGGFEQIMRVVGTLTLEGERIPVDCFSIRDRSWGQTRDEMPMPIPPITWMTGIVDEGFAFMVMAYDEPELNPDLHAHFKVPEPGKGLVKGWVWRDGEMRSLVRARKNTVREGLVPRSHVLEFEDSTGRVWNATGTVKSNMPFNGWPNLCCRWGLTEWSIEGRTAWGETQDTMWAEFIRLFARR